MKKIPYILLSLILLSLYSCKKENIKPDIKKAVVIKAADPVIQAIFQRTEFDASGKPVYVLLIAGTNFNKDFKDDKVLFNDLAAPAIAGDSLHFKVVVPEAVLATETTLTIVMDGKSTVYAKPFITEQIAPVISTLNTEEGMRGSRLIIQGALFSPVLSENTVTLNGVNIPIDSVASRDYEGSSAGGGVYGGISFNVLRDIYTGRILNVTIPPNAGSGKLVVTSYGKSITYPYDVKVLPSTFTSVKSSYFKSMSFDAAGNMYGTANNTIVKVTPGGTISTLATIGDEYFRLGDCVADAAGNVYVASGDDYSGLPGTIGPLYRYTENSSKIYKITSGGQVSVLAGSTRGYADGQGTDAKFISPVHLARNATTGDLYVGDALMIRKITAGGLVSTVAGNNPQGGLSSGVKDGQGIDASFSQINGITADSRTGDLYVIDWTNVFGDMRKVTAGGYVSTMNITPAVPPEDRFPIFFSPFNAAGMVVDASGSILIASEESIFKIKDGVMSDTHLNPFAEGISGMALDGSGKLYFNTIERLYKVSF